MELKETKEKKQTPLYKQIKILGQGSFGKAYLVKNTVDNKNYVIKSMVLSDMSEKEQKEAYLEAKILEKLKHPNIIKFIEVFRSTKPSAMLNIVMDFADGGDLQRKIKEYQKEGRSFNEDTILDWFTQLCLAIKHIHDRKILHRDLKSQNVFLTLNGIIKLGDFGIAKCLNFTMEKAETIVGTPYYLSPEIVQNIPYSFKSDIWSLGVLLYEMICLRMPFEANSLPLLSLKISRGVYSPIPSKYSLELRGLVKGLLSLDPAKRPSINEILSYGIIQRRSCYLLNEIGYVGGGSSITNTSNTTNVVNISKDKDKDIEKANEQSDLVVKINKSNIKEDKDFKNMLPLQDKDKDKDKEGTKFINKKEFFEKKKEQREGVIHCINKQNQNRPEEEVFEEDKYKAYLKRVTMNEKKSELEEDDEMKNSKKMLIELSNIQLEMKNKENMNNSPSPSKEVKENKESNKDKDKEKDDENLKLNLNQISELDLKDNNNDNDKNDDVTECVTELSEEIVNEIKSELIDNIGESNFNISFEIVDKNTPKELFYYDKKAIIDEITSNKELSKLSCKQKDLIFSKIPEIFALVFDKKQKDFKFSFKSLPKKKD